MDVFGEFARMFEAIQYLHEIKLSVVIFSYAGGIFAGTLIAGAVASFAIEQEKKKI